VNLGNVMDELGTALEAIDGLRVHPYYADRITPPSAVVAWPDIDYDATFGRGADRLTVPVYVLVGKVDARSSRDRLAVYLDGGDTKSVKAALEGGTYTACDSVRVTSATVESIEVAAVEYLGGVFQVDIIGQGS
jgi:hypothetical protein